MTEKPCWISEGNKGQITFWGLSLVIFQTVWFQSVLWLARKSLKCDNLKDADDNADGDDDKMNWW